MNIALIGPRGAGKSKISRKLTKIIGNPVVSTDMIAVYESGGHSIEEQIREANGDWKNFRDLEFRILEKISEAKNIILDCGGGIIFDVNDLGEEIVSERKVRLLKSFAKIIFVYQSKENLLQKVKNDSNRPTLSQINSYEEILNRRMPVYSKIADLQLNLDGKKPEEAASEILQLLKGKF